jgi:hypothetical protein
MRPTIEEDDTYSFSVDHPAIEEDGDDDDDDDDGGGKGKGGKGKSGKNSKKSKSCKSSKSSKSSKCDDPDEDLTSLESSELMYSASARRIQRPDLTMRTGLLSMLILPVLSVL